MKAEIAAAWDAQYAQGRYENEPPLPFVDRILNTLDAHPAQKSGRGLDVGCGNGRNLAPLLERGLDVHGLDISPIAISSLCARHPEWAPRLHVGTFDEWTTPLAYLLAIQVFQHGDEAQTHAYFARTAQLLHPGGLFFLRVNSASTQPFHRARRLESSASGGFSLRYDEGPKAGLTVHFFAEDELRALTRHEFDVITAPREIEHPRTPPQSGSWFQWEAIWQKK